MLSFRIYLNYYSNQKNIYSQLETITKDLRGPKYHDLKEKDAFLPSRILEALVYQSLEWCGLNSQETIINTPLVVVFVTVGIFRNHGIMITYTQLSECQESSFEHFRQPTLPLENWNFKDQFSMSIYCVTYSTQFLSGDIFHGTCMRDPNYQLNTEKVGKFLSRVCSFGKAHYIRHTKTINVKPSSFICIYKSRSINVPNLQKTA